MINYKPLAQTLKKKGVSLKEISGKAGLKESVLVCKMNNNEYISMEALDKICSVLESPVEDIIQWSKGNQKASEKVNVDWEVVMGLLQEKGMSLNELSEKCRLTQSTLSHSKNRGTALRGRTVGLMAKILDVDVKTLEKAEERLASPDKE